MAKEIITKEWVFKTADGPVETLPPPQNFRGSIPETISLDDIARVEREANKTYQIVKFRGVSYEHIVFNPEGDPAKTVSFTPTLFSGARRNPGNMHEKAIDAIASPDVPIDYLTPWFNHPAGSMRRPDYKYFLKTSRFTRGTGEDDDPLRPLDSMLDIVELYEKMGWAFPSYFSADAEGGRQLLGRAAAFGTSIGAHINGMPGFVRVDGYTRINVYADIANRLNRLGGSAVSLEVNGKTQRMAKQNMGKVYPWHKYLAHQAPIPAVMHPVDSARALRINRALNRHNNPSQLDDHAVYFDLLAMMAINDGPITFTYGTDNLLGPANEIKTFLDGFVHEFPNAFRSSRRTITLKMIQNVGIDHNTHTPAGRTAVERRTFGLGAMLGLVKDKDGALATSVDATKTAG